MRKIGELKGKPIVEGNPNEVKNNQIHAKTEGGGITLSERKNGNLETISGGSSSGDNSKRDIHYYKKIKPINTIKLGNIAAYVLIDKTKELATNSISNFANSNDYTTFTDMYSYVDMISIDWEDKMFSTETGAVKHKDILTAYNISITDFLEINYLEEITEEEFYNLD